MIAFERATPDDAPALTEVQTRCFDDDARRFLDQPSGGPPGYDSEEWQVMIMQQAHAYYKILDGEQIIGGIIVFQYGKSRYELGRIYLDPDYQDRGIGTRAMQFVEGAYPDAEVWQLETPTWATRNQHFYEKLGYVKVSETGDDVNYEKQMPHQ
ncbi:MAG: GNAT family N-acetyltransferase [Chloroflexi bacterium]|nr:GNAT family N-acetyltransferase [Chloroflexota bacterium]